MADTDVFELYIEDTPLGYRWLLYIVGKNVKGGYAPTMWQALDDSNEALHDLFYSPLGAYYKSQIGAKHGGW